MTIAHTVLPSEILNFWFTNESKWFNSSPEFDELIKSKFKTSFLEAVAGKLEHWEHSPTDLLALVIIYDQFTRNMFRGTTLMYLEDGVAQALVRNALNKHWDEQLDNNKQRLFLYLPLMHSENINDQNLCVKLIEKLDMPDALTHAKRHRDIIQRFGRFPERNPILQRESTKAELKFLAANKGDIVDNTVATSI